MDNADTAGNTGHTPQNGGGGTMCNTDPNKTKTWINPVISSSIFM